MCIKPDHFVRVATDAIACIPCMLAYEVVFEWLACDKLFLLALTNARFCGSFRHVNRFQMASVD